MTPEDIRKLATEHKFIAQEIEGEPEAPGAAHTADVLRALAAVVDAAEEWATYSDERDDVRAMLCFNDFIRALSKVRALKSQPTTKTGD